MTASVADSARITAADDETATAFALRVISETALRRARHTDNQRPDDVRGRPYEVWRAEERAYWRLDEWSRMIRQAPHGGGGIDVHRRTWNWTSTMNGGRTECRPSGVVSLPGETAGNPLDGVGHSPVMILRNPGQYAPAPAPRDPVPARGVRITFPDWVPE
jgi:hypothetical protein